MSNVAIISWQMEWHYQRGSIQNHYKLQTTTYSQQITNKRWSEIQFGYTLYDLLIWRRNALLFYQRTANYTCLNSMQPVLKLCNLYPVWKSSPQKTRPLKQYSLNQLHREGNILAAAQEDIPLYSRNKKSWHDPQLFVPFSYGLS